MTSYPARRGSITFKSVYHIMIDDYSNQSLPNLPLPGPPPPESQNDQQENSFIKVQWKERILEKSWNILKKKEKLDTLDPQLMQSNRSLVERGWGFLKKSKKSDTLDSQLHQSTISIDFDTKEFIPRSQSIEPSWSFLQKTKLYALDSQLQQSNGSIGSDTDELIQRNYNPKVEEAMIYKMKGIALVKAEQGLWKETYDMLGKILESQISLFGFNNAEIANTLYYIGSTLNRLGQHEDALIELEKGLNILFPQRYTEKNMDLASIFYEIGMIYGKNNDIKAALYYLDLSKQVEIFILGKVLNKTLRSIRDLESVSNYSYWYNSVL